MTRPSKISLSSISLTHDLDIATLRRFVWSYDFLHDQTSDGRPLRMLTLIDEYSRECWTFDVNRRLNSVDVVDRTVLYSGNT